MIIKRHPGRFLFLFTGFRIFPEPRCSKVPVQRNWVEAPFTTSSESEKTKSQCKDRTRGRGANVAIAAGEENEGTEEENDRWESVCQVESNELFFARQFIVNIFEKEKKKWQQLQDIITFSE